jgi:hypothetical protein
MRPNRKASEGLQGSGMGYPSQNPRKPARGPKNLVSGHSGLLATLGPCFALGVSGRTLRPAGKLLGGQQGSGNGDGEKG